MRLMLLGEKLIAFRDRDGPRRRDGSSLPAPLRLAVLRPQRGGRPPLHLSRLEVRRRRQLPRHAERRAGSRISSDKVKAKAYKVNERNGLIWVYMGARAEAPPLPMIEATLLPEAEISASVRAARVQLAAGARRRHRHLAFRFPACRQCRRRTRCRARQPRCATRSPIRAPEYHVADTDWGTMYAAYRPADDGQHLLAFRALRAFRSGPQMPQGSFVDRVIGARLGADGRHAHDVRAR